jgi:hypothetical protein
VTLTKPVVVNGLTKANAELFDEYGSDLELIANTMLGPGAIGEGQLNSALLGPIASKYGLRKLGTGATEALAGNTEVLSKASAEAIAQEAVKKSELPAAQAVATVNVTTKGIPASSETDEVTLVEGNIVLCPNQTAASERGLWEVKKGTTAWVRPVGFTGELALGVFVDVLAGVKYAGSIWELRNTSRVVVGTTAQEWEVNSAGATVGQKELEEKLRVQSTPGGENMGVGRNALSQMLATTKVEQEKHHGNMAFGDGALESLTGVIEGPVKPSAEVSTGATLIKLTGAAAKGWVKSNVPNVVFNKLPSGVTTLAAGVAYWVKASSSTGFELSATETGAAIKVEGAALTTAGTEMTLSASCEDNTAHGAGALGNLTYGGGNIGVGERAGHSLTTGEENLLVGIEAMANAVGAVAKNNVGIGFRALFNATSAAENLGVGYNVLLALTTGAQNIALGEEALGSMQVGNGNTAVGWKALSKLTAQFAFATALGYEAGGEATGEGGVYLGFEAGKSVSANNQLYIANSSTSTPLVQGEFPNAVLKLNAEKLTLGKAAGKVGLYGATPVAQAKEIKAAGTAKLELAFLEKEAEILEEIRTLLHNIGITE